MVLDFKRKYFPTSLSEINQSLLNIHSCFEIEFKTFILLDSPTPFLFFPFKQFDNVIIEGISKPR